MPSVLLALCFLLTSLALLGGTSKTNRCANPLVRKEWWSLERKERENCITAPGPQGQCLANSPNEHTFSPTVNPPDIAPYNASGSIYDDFVYAHMGKLQRYTVTIIHFTGLFFPWHRWHLYAVEKALRTRCGYHGTLPYWDWTQGISPVVFPHVLAHTRIDAHHFYESSFFKDSNPKSGLGGWGDASTQFRVLDGALSATSSFQLSYPFPHTLRRNFTLFGPVEELFPPGFVWNHTRPANASFTRPIVESLIDGFVGDFKGFQDRTEGVEGPHLNVHFIVGGIDMGGACPIDAPPGCIGGPTFSPNDPLFFMHHAMIDRIWFKWQRKHKLNKYAFEGGSVQTIDDVASYSLYPTGGPPFLTMDSELPTDGLDEPLSVSDMISTTEGPLCYVYDDE
ncbi:Di-copper centre-containing protein [Mycena pura]|uniref:Di-copper centre-containing protein n=1 Tax=Mycena pura TaxID=153505 RepID=A0AAD6YL11_9AGAR|nr:Di-copper centre-containing protein [Mycena pura]